MSKKLKFKEWIKKNSWIINNDDMMWPKFASGGNLPFETNPWFIPQKTVSHAAQQKIFETYRSNPEKWTPRALAVEYQISIPRITAILKTGALAQRMIKEKKPLQLDLAKGMDKMLGSIDVHLVSKRDEPFEPVRSHYGGSMIPYFQFGDDLQSLNPKDAAAMLLKDPWSNIDKRLNVQAERVFSDSHKEVDYQSKILSRPEKIHASKVDFMFVDTNKKTILVRDKKGTLREASNVEKWYKKAEPLEKYLLE